MKQLLLSLLLISGFVYGQQEIHFNKVQIDLKNYPFSISKIIDNTNSEYIGKFSDGEVITIKNGITNAINAVIKNNGENKIDCELHINNIEIYETRVKALNFANIGINISLYKTQDDKQIEVASYKNSAPLVTETTINSKPKKKYAQLIKSQIKLAFRSMAKNINKKIKPTFNTINPNHLNGIYHSYNDYLYAKVDDKTSLTPVYINDNKGKPSYLKHFSIGGNQFTKKISQAWGIVYKDELYLNVFGYFYLVNVDNEGFYTHCRPYFYVPIKTYGATATGAILGGLIGAAIGAIIDDANSTKLEGGFPYKKYPLDIETGALQLNRINKLTIENGYYLYYPETNNPFDTFKVAINGIEHILRKNQTLQIKQTSKAPLQICVTKPEKFANCAYLRLYDEPFQAYKINISGKAKLTPTIYTIKHQAIDVITNYYFPLDNRVNSY